MKRFSIIILFALAVVPVGAQSQTQSTPLRIAISGKPWVFQIVAPSFKVEQDSSQPDGRRYLLATDSGFTLSVTLEKVSGTATPDGCKQVFLSRLQPNAPFKATDVKQSQALEMAVMEYMVAEFNGVPVSQKNVFGCLVKEDVYVDIHLSKTSFQAVDQTRMMAILNSTSFVSMEASTALFGEGSSYFLRQQYDKAIGPYQKALDLEKKEQKLGTAQWRVLIDNLGMAYGITGNLAASEEVMKYGLSKDPTYPMFYYITANIYGERNDLPNTLKYLQLTLTYKGNTIPGEKLPDPLTDDSFTRFVKNDEFRKVAAQFK